jgi:2-haloacid dehalogenase
MADLSGIRAITFDCYGTLIDWESGILKALRPILAVHGKRVADAEVLGLFARFEAEEEGEYKPYALVLADVLDRIAGELGFAVEDRERERLAGSVGRWEPFADTVATLRKLGGAYRLVVCSNVDDDLFAGTAARLGHTEEAPLFERVVTAEYCRSYKPDPRHFRVALALLDLPPERVLHAAQSRYHDIGPAAAMGMRTCWVNRASLRPGVGLTPPGEHGAAADLAVADLASLARHLGL